MVVLSLKIVPVACPICGRPPDIGPCEPWPTSEGPQPWYAGCYAIVPTEHYVGVNGDDMLDAIRNWNVEVAKIIGLIDT